MLLFRINKEKWGALVKLRGWKHPISALARRTGYTKSYCSQAINGGIPITHDFMLVLIKVAGASLSEAEEWASLFEITEDPTEEEIIRKAYQRRNYLKFQGKAPYNRDSMLGKMRKTDKARDLERLAMPSPIPAGDFYDDAVPKGIQAKQRYGR